MRHSIFGLNFVEIIENLIFATLRTSLIGVARLCIDFKTLKFDLLQISR